MGFMSTDQMATLSSSAKAQPKEQPGFHEDLRWWETLRRYLVEDQAKTAKWKTSVRT